MDARSDRKYATDPFKDQFRLDKNSSFSEERRNVHRDQRLLPYLSLMDDLQPRLPWAFHEAFTQR